MSVEKLLIKELIARLEVVKERALGDSASVAQEFCVGLKEHEAASAEADDTAEVIDEAIRRLGLFYDPR